MAAKLPAKTLVQASDTTRLWLRELRDRIPQMEYNEAGYWASFKPQGGTIVTHLNPSSKRIRVFLPLDLNSTPDLNPSPSTKAWSRFPSVFVITRKEDLPRAASLILMAVASETDEKSPTQKRPDIFIPEEISPDSLYAEGAVHQVTVNAYERNQMAREVCLRHYGRSCAVCEISFRQRYGAAGAGYIQVHHVQPISDIGKKYLLDPIKDLRPVCPNCHAVIHRRDPPFEISEVKEMLRKAKDKN